jgi:tetratricopeptide (TPR) repeat protein
VSDEERAPVDEATPTPRVRRQLVMPAWQVVLAVAAAFVVGHLVGQKKAERGETKTPVEAQVADGLEGTTDPEWALQIADAHYDRGVYNIAAMAYERAIELGTDNANVRTDLGTCYRRLGDPQRAVQEYRRAAAGDPTHANSRYNLGVTLWHDLHDEEGARAAWEDFLRVAPDDPKAEQARKGLEALSGVPSEEPAPPE